MTFEYYVKEKAERAYEDGREEGAAQEKREIAKSMLQEGLTKETNEKITGLAPEEITKL